MTVIIDEVEVDGYERVVHGYDSTIGLDCYIAIHSTKLGPALGGLRMWNYQTSQDALTDVLRLSEGMTLKNALAELRLGGGKAVINRSNTDGTIRKDILLAFADVLNEFKGEYLTAEDVGCTVEDMVTISDKSDYVSTVNGCGDPSFATAYGIVRGWQACAQFIRTQNKDMNWPKLPNDPRCLKDVTVTIQGIGAVGTPLAIMAHELGMKVRVTDLHFSIYTALAEMIPVTWVDPDLVFDTQDLIFAPCALGAVLNSDTVECIGSEVICGSANNQLEHPHTGYAVMQKNITYAPDFLVNAGGVINVFREFTHVNNDFEIAIQLDKIYDRTYECLKMARRNNIPTNFMAERMSRKKLKDIGSITNNNDDWLPEHDVNDVGC